MAYLNIIFRPLARSLVRIADKVDEIMVVFFLSTHLYVTTTVVYPDEAGLGHLNQVVTVSCRHAGLQRVRCAEPITYR